MTRLLCIDLCFVWAKRLLISAIVFASLVQFSLADDSESSPLVGRQVIVIKEVARLGVDAQVKLEGHFGEVFVIGKVNEGFYWIPSRRAWIQIADVLLLEDAVDYFSRELEESDEAKWQHARGIAYAALEQEDRALADFDAALDLNPGLIGVYISRGTVFGKKGEIERAQQDFSKAIELDPDNKIAFHKRSMTWSDLGDFDQALQDANRAIHLDPEFAAAYNNRGVMFREKGNYEKAIEDYNSAIRLEPDYAAAFANRGYAWKRLRQFDKALTDYEEALRRDPDFAQGHNDLAWLLATCPVPLHRDGAKALEHATKACELTKFQNWEYVDTLAAACAETGDFAAAIKWSQAALKRAPESDKQVCQTHLKAFESHNAYRDTE